MPTIAANARPNVAADVQPELPPDPDPVAPPDGAPEDGPAACSVAEAPRFPFAAAACSDPSLARVGTVVVDEPVAPPAMVTDVGVDGPVGVSGDAPAVGAPA